MALKNGLAITTFLVLLSTSSLSFACDSEFFDECLDGVGPAVTSSDSLRVSSSQITKSLRDREESDNSDTTAQLNSTGMSAGDNFGRWSVWGSYTGSDFDADIPLINALDGLGNPVPLAVYDGDSRSFLLGADTLIGSQFVIGVALGYETTDITTEYNGGDNESDGYSITPYAAYLFNDIFSIDVSAGYSSLDYDTDRIDNTMVIPLEVTLTRIAGLLPQILMLSSIMAIGISLAALVTSIPKKIKMTTPKRVDQQLVASVIVILI